MINKTLNLRYFKVKFSKFEMQEIQFYHYFFEE